MDLNKRRPPLSYETDTSLTHLSNETLLWYLDNHEMIELKRLSRILCEILRRMNEIKSILPIDEIQPHQKE